MTKQQGSAGPTEVGPAGDKPGTGESVSAVAVAVAASSSAADSAADSTETCSDDHADEVAADQDLVIEGEIVDDDVASPEPEAATTTEKVSSPKDPSPKDPSPKVSSPKVSSPKASAEGSASASELDPEAAVEAVVEVVAELGALKTQLDERTADLLRVTAEYANYRKRVERDRSLAADQATASVLISLLPVLDDFDRAREHGDLIGPFGAVAEKLIADLGKYGLMAFGAKGDPFDPKRHEAVAHATSAEVTEPTCVEILRRGYQVGDRLLRAAMVAVADPD